MQNTPSAPPVNRSPQDNDPRSPRHNPDLTSSSSSVSSTVKKVKQQSRDEKAQRHRPAEGRPNAIWSELIGFIEPYLDVWSLLHLRQTCVVLARHKFKLSGQNWWVRFCQTRGLGAGMLCMRGPPTLLDRSASDPVVAASGAGECPPTTISASFVGGLAGCTGTVGPPSIASEYPNGSENTQSERDPTRDPGCARLPLHLNRENLSASRDAYPPGPSLDPSCPPHPGRECPRLLSYSGFRGHDGSLICDRLIRKTLQLLHSSTRSDGVVIDLSHCVLIKDSQLASIGIPFIPNPLPESKVIYTKLMGLILDFCPQITDKGLTALLSAHLPHLQYLSFKCIRSEFFTGHAFKGILASVLWPKFRSLNVDFTSISLEALQAVAQFIREQSCLGGASMGGGGSVSQSAAQSLAPSLVPSAVNSGNLTQDSSINPGSSNFILSEFPPTEPPSSNATFEKQDFPPHPPISSLVSATPSISFVGSWASKNYLDAIGAKPLIKSFAMALNSGDPERVAEVVHKADKEVDELLAKRIEELDDPLAPCMLGQGGKYLVNVPVTCPTSEEGGVNVWTLPISVAILNGRVDMVKGLHECGADLEIIDHLGKSPIYRAVSSGNLEVAEYLLSCGVNLTPLNVLQPTAINAAIERNYVEITKLLLEHDYPLNFRCPAVKAFKSPLHVACEHGNEELMHSLLDWGANPNSYSGSYKNSPVMLAYKSNPDYLPVFLQGGAFTSVALAAEILTSAIAKNDVMSARLLVRLFPELLTRQHATWSLPHIQASKMGKAETLQLFLTAQASNLAPPANGSSTDRSTFPTPFPLSSPARVQSGFLSLPETVSERSANPFLFLPRNRNNADRQRMRTKLKFWGRHKASHGCGSIGARGDNGDVRQPITDVREAPPRLIPAKSTDVTSQNPPAGLALVDDGSDSQRRACCSMERIKGFVDWQPSEGMREFLKLSDPQNGNTALHYAAEEGFNDCIRLLIRHGAELNIENAAGQLPLHLACYENREETVNLLLCCGSDVNTVDKTTQETPLTSAIRARNDQLAFMILQHITHRMRHVPDTIGKNLLLSDSDQSVQLQGDPVVHNNGTGPLPICPLSYALYFGRFEIAVELLKMSTQLMIHFPSVGAVQTTHDYVREKLAAGGDDLGRRVMKQFLRLYRAQIPPVTSGAEGTAPAEAAASGDQANSSQDEDLSSPDSLSADRRCRICEWAAGVNIPPDWLEAEASWYHSWDSVRGCRRPQQDFEQNSQQSGASQSTQEQLSRSRRLHGRLKQAARKPLQLFVRSKTPEEFAGSSSNQPTR